MKQLVMISPGKLVYQEVEIPNIKENEVLLKMKYIGICGSDIHVNHGKHPYTSYPVVQGHEVSAEIVKIGKEVKDFEIGDRVTVQPQVVCGKCYQCLHDDYNICDNLKVMGFQTTGMASEFFPVDSSKLLLLPDGVNFEKGSMIEPLAVAVHAIKRGGDIKGKKVIVLGAGPIGNLVAQSAKGMGADSVIITDISDHRLKVAKECGIDFCINTNKDNITDVIAEKFGSNKADIIFECVGINTTTDQAINNARKGSKIIIVGVFGDLASVNMGLIQDRELTLIGTLMYKKEDFEKAIELINENKVNLDELISNKFKFEEYKQAYDYIDQCKDKIMKVLIEIN